MSVHQLNNKILFGLKVKQLRREQSYSFAELSKKSGLSVSYLNEIEKGKKYPKQDKIDALAKALGVSSKDLTSRDFDERMTPVVDLLKSNFLNELPLDLFGIELTKVVEIIASAPARVGAFISTLLELSRNYALREENFYFSALRSYLELHNNYFPELEEAVQDFEESVHLPDQRPLTAEVLGGLLEKHYGYTLVKDGLRQYPELTGLRSVFLPKKRELLLNGNLNDLQKSFQYGKELGFQFLKIKERAYTSSLLRSRVFEEVLNHSKSIYFSVALHMPLDRVKEDLKTFFARKSWDGEAWLDITKRYVVTPEMFYHRLTNILPQFFGIKKLFFFRFSNHLKTGHFEIDKELHLNHNHRPHSNSLDEHYCRRWVSISLLEDLRKLQKEGKYVDTIVRAQISSYVGSRDQYLCLTIARPAYPSPDKNVSVTIGLLINDELRERINFLDDPALVRADVHTTCERCAIMDCKVRASEPIILQKRQRIHEIEERLETLIQK